jgi:hypothetical protein
LQRHAGTARPARIRRIAAVTGQIARVIGGRGRHYRYSRAVISRVGMPSSSTYQSPMIILIAGITA